MAADTNRVPQSPPWRFSTRASSMSSAPSSASGAGKYRRGQSELTVCAVAEDEEELGEAASSQNLRKGASTVSSAHSMFAHQPSYRRTRITVATRPSLWSAWQSAPSDPLRRSFFSNELLMEKQMAAEKIRCYEQAEAQALVQDIVGEDPVRSYLATVADSAVYATVLTGLTVAGVILLCFETEMRSTNSYWNWLIVCNWVLLGCYTLDIVIRLIVLRCWFFISIISILELALVILDFVLEIMGDVPNVFATLKVIRFCRLARVVKYLVQVRDLYLMLKGIAASLRALFFGMILLLLMVLMFSILAYQVVRGHHNELQENGEYGDCSVCPGAFDTLGDTALTLLSTVLTGEEFGIMAMKLLKKDPASGFIMFGVYAAVQLLLINTIAAVMVDRQQQAREQDKDYMRLVQAEELALSLSELEAALQQISEEGTGTTTLSDIHSYYDRCEDFRAHLNRIDIYKEDLDIIFSILAHGDHTKVLEANEFCAGLHALRHKDAHTLAVFTNHYAQTALTNLSDLKKEFKDLSKDMSKLKEREESHVGQMQDLAAKVFKPRSPKKSSEERSNLSVRWSSHNVERRSCGGDFLVAAKRFSGEGSGIMEATGSIVEKEPSMMGVDSDLSAIARVVVDDALEDPVLDATSLGDVVLCEHLVHADSPRSNGRLSPPMPDDDPKASAQRNGLLQPICEDSSHHGQSLNGSLPPKAGCKSQTNGTTATSVNGALPPASRRTNKSRVEFDVGTQTSETVTINHERVHASAPPSSRPADLPLTEESPS
eukprot:TRINITY_DN28558_c0_g1_i1.p1 TRINITY_DN28558_c0_g1~~TRINITY_DN28558_c0_g1_i1.p1  ORF type:complete len:795 (-),score=153.70 TRINITY_DN28558_c0_g1_i1:401-2719(-)